MVALTFISFLLCLHLVDVSTTTVARIVFETFLKVSLVIYEHVRTPMVAADSNTGERASMDVSDCSIRLKLGHAAHHAITLPSCINWLTRTCATKAR